MVKFSLPRYLWHNQYLFNALIPVSKQLRRKTTIYILENIYILYAFTKWVKGTVMRNATFFLKHTKKLYLVWKRSLIIFLKCHMHHVCVRDHTSCNNMQIKVLMYTTRIPTIQNNCASPNVYERKPRREGIALHELSLSFTQYKSFTIACSPRVTNFGWFDIVMRLKDPKSVYFKLIWDESAANLLGVKFYVGWMRGTLLSLSLSLSDKVLEMILNWWEWWKVANSEP